MTDFERKIDSMMRGRKEQARMAFLDYRGHFSGGNPRRVFIAGLAIIALLQLIGML
ncbi:hypothetical protein HSBAA_29180 [Vreelandella sulfidaeris]|uniref:Uncharacterized protein n=1 Tax=Vreelandella sulfidaeris TaxID=115553 RepID=A0A455U655_9GAMM|nr:hypothetical protein HSBAA_29180 [Halomonas sulfidaeris]